MNGADNRTELKQPIVRVSAAELVAKGILDQVKSGALRPGDRLPTERNLALSLQVSRPTVREAIRGLTILGVARTRQGGGAYITNLDADALLEPLHFFLSLEESHLGDLYDARMLIESDVARRAAVNISDDALDGLARIMAKQENTLDNPLRFRESDKAFHQLIWEGSGNAFLKRIGASLNVIGLEFRRVASETPGILRQSYVDHHRLLKALQDRDPDAAAEMASAHMKNVYRATVKSNQKGA